MTCVEVVVPAAFGDHLNGRRTQKEPTWAERVREQNVEAISGKLMFVQLQIFEGRRVATISKVEVEEVAKVWRNTVIAHVVGDMPYFLHFQAFAKRMWRPRGAMKIFFPRENRFFLIRFEEEGNCNRILEEGPWLFDGRLIILKRWCGSVNYEREMLDKLPVWVRFPDLPIHLWSTIEISKVASLVDVFAKFKDEEGKFKQELSKDAKGLLYLHEASWLGTREEVILGEALNISKGHLERLLVEQSQCNGMILAQIERALKMPFHRGMRRPEAKHHIINYDPENKAGGHVLIELAKMDYNLLQSLHQAEIKDLSIWWKETALVEKLSFARDRVVEGYFWILGVHFEPQFSQPRMLLTKLLAFTSLTDDMFDAHGTIEELQLFDSVIQRWDLHNTNHLPEYMRAYIDSLISHFKEIEEYLTINGRIHGMNYLIGVYQKLVKAYFEEAMWANKGHMPTLEEYLNVSVTSSAYPFLTSAAFILMGGQEVTIDALDWVSTVPKILEYSAQLSRIKNDIVSTKFEQQRIHVATSLQCYMNDHGVKEDVACRKLKEMNSDTWKDINKEWLLKSDPSLRYLKMLALNFNRMLEVVYKNKDAYTDPSDEMKENIAALLVHQIKD